MATRRAPVPRRASRPYNRTDRIGELVREIVASELERIGDERLDLVTVTGVRVDGSLEHADVFWSSMQAEEDGRLEEVVEALEDRRWKVQQVVNREVRARKTPQITFRPDDVLASALRVEAILRDIEPRADEDTVEEGAVEEGAVEDDAVDGAAVDRPTDRLDASGRLVADPDVPADGEPV